MAKVIALAHTARQTAWTEALRICIVCGCGIALIAADKAHLFLSL